jgi:hypothetical protein
MPLGVQGGLGTSVAEPCLDGLDVGTVGDEQAGEVAAQVVIAEARGKVFDFAAGFPHRALDGPRGELAAILTGQKCVVTPVGTGLR